MTIFFFLTVFAVHAQELPTYILPNIVVTPAQTIFTPEPDLVVKIPSNTSPKAVTLDDALRGVPGVVVARAGGPGQPSSLFLRGAASEHVLVLLDGVVINDPGQPTGGFDFSTIDLNMVEKIEVYKGPQALRFGSGAIGGVINIVTKRGDEDQWMVGLRSGAHDTNQQSLAVMTGSSATRYSISVNRYESQGISAAKGGTERDGHRYISAAARVSHQLEDGTNIHFFSRALGSHSDLDFAETTVDDPTYFVDNFQLSNVLRGEKQIRPHWAAQLTLAQFYLHRRYENKADMNDPTEFLDNRYANSWQVENVHTVHLTRNISMTAGPSYKEEKSKFSASLAGLFSELSYAYEQMFVNLGARYDRHSKFGDQWSHALNPGYQIATTQTTLSLRWASAFKSPSLFQLYDPTFGNSSLSPEYVRGEEAIVEQPVSNKDRFKVTAFRYYYRDLIQFTTSYQNVSSARSRGVEVEYSRDISRGFEVQTAYTYTDSRNEQTGRRLLRRPLQSWRLSAGYQFDDSLSGRIEYRGVGRRSDIDARSWTATTTNSYDVLDISIAKSIGKAVQITASVENAFNKSYEEISGYNTPGLGFYLGIRLLRASPF